MFLHYVYPSVTVQKQRILGVAVDRVDETTGSRFGVLEVDEQGGALALLEGLPQASSLRRWALVEFFLPGDDRYFDRFALLTSELLATDDGERVGSRLVRLLRADFLPSKRAPFAAALTRADSRGLARRWMSEAEALGILDPGGAPDSGKASLVGAGSQTTPAHDTAKGDLDESGDELLLPGTFGRKAGVRTLEECLRHGYARLAAGDKAGARDSLVQGLEAAQSAGWGIWTMSADSRRALDALMRDTGSVPAAVSALCSVIMNEEHAADWSIAQALIESGLPALPHEVGAEVLSIVGDHFRCILRPEYEQGNARCETEPLRPNAAPLTPDQAIDDLLVALLDHPNQFARGRAADIIVWLAQHGAIGFDVSRLSARVASTHVGHGRELAAGILHALSLTCQDALGDKALKHGLVQRMLSDPNFIIRYAAGEVVRQMQFSGSSDSGEEAVAVASDESPLHAVQRPWQWRRDTEAILRTDGGEDARARARQWLDTICAGESPDQVVALWKVRRAGFGCQRGETWSTPWEREAAFRAVGNIDGAEKKLRLADEAMWNPMWPDRQLRVNWHPLGDRLRGQLARREYDDCFVVDGKFLLHCLELVWDDRQATMKEFEVVAFLVPSAFFNGHFDIDTLTVQRSVHGAPVDDHQAHHRVARASEAAVVRFSDRPRIGGEVTPARPSARLLEVTGLSDEAFESVCWRDGRLWDPWGVGPPVARGCALLMESSARIAVSYVDLVWAVFDDGELRLVVDPTRRRVHVSGGRDESF